MRTVQRERERDDVWIHPETWSKEASLGYQRLPVKLEGTGGIVYLLLVSILDLHLLMLGGFLYLFEISALEGLFLYPQCSYLIRSLILPQVLFPSRNMSLFHHLPKAPTTLPTMTATSLSHVFSTSFVGPLELAPGI
jgi:hypothetical protein